VAFLHVLFCWKTLDATRFVCNPHYTQVHKVVWAAVLCVTVVLSSDRPTTSHGHPSFFLQGTLRLFCVPACFLQPPGAPPLLEQRLAPQLRDLTAGRPLQQQLAGTMQPGTLAMVHGGAAYWYPCPSLRSKVPLNSGMVVPGAVLRVLDKHGKGNVVVTVQVVAPAAAAAAAVGGAEAGLASLL
jgi:hypothetical protein